MQRNTNTNMDIINTNAKKNKITLQCTTSQCSAMHSYYCSETPQLLTPDGSNMTHIDPG